MFRRQVNSRQGYSPLEKGMTYARGLGVQPKKNEKLNKINDTPFKIENINFNLDDNIFIRMSEINNLRRELIEKLIIKRYTSRNFY